MFQASLTDRILIQQLGPPLFHVYKALCFDMKHVMISTSLIEAPKGSNTFMMLPRGSISHLPNRQGKNAGTLTSGSISLAFPRMGHCLFSLWAQSTRYWAGNEKAWSQKCPLALKPRKALGRWKLPIIWLAPAGLDQVQIASFTFIQTTVLSQITPQHSADLFVGGLTSTCSTPKVLLHL